MITVKRKYDLGNKNFYNVIEKEYYSTDNTFSIEKNPNLFELGFNGIKVSETLNSL